MTGQFILGLGAQKAGSSWARSYLASDSHADFGPIKEYHVWDALCLPQMIHYDHRGRSWVRNTAEHSLRRILRRAPSTAALRGRLQDDPTTYLDFFAQRIDMPRITVTGDFTPAYAGLSVSALKAIRDGFEQRGLSVKAVFLMRDPVARCVSAVQMNRRKGTRTEGVPLSGTLDAAALTYAKTPQARIRADYSHTVTALRQVFDERSLFFGLYETLFHPTEIARLSDFAGVTFRPELAERQINTHTKAEAVNEQTRMQLRRYFDPTYKFCASAFPQTREVWMPARQNNVATR